MESFQEGDIVVPLDGSQRSRTRSRRRSSGQSLEGSAHSTSSYTFEEVDSVYSEYTLESLDDSSSFHNSFSSMNDAVAHAEPPTNVEIPASSDSLSEMKNFLRSELGLETPVKVEPKEEEPKKKAPKNEALTEMQTYLRSELGIDMLQKAPSSSPSSGSQNSTIVPGLDLPASSVSVDNSKELAEESELARSIAALKEGVDIEVIEYVVSDDEFAEEIIDDVFDHMGGLEGRDSVMLESFGLHSIVEVADSEYGSDIDDSGHLKRISEVSILSDFPMVGDTDDEVDTEPIEPQTTGLHETAKNSKQEKINVEESPGSAELGKATSPKSSKKAAKWKDRLKKKRDNYKSEGEHDDDKMDINIVSSDEPENQATVSATSAAKDSGTGPSKSNTLKSEEDESKEKQHDGSLTPTPDLRKEPEADETILESGSRAEMTELTLAKASPESKNNRGAKAAKWKDRLQKKRSKSIEANGESDIGSPKSLNSPDAKAEAESNAAGADGENDLKDFPNVPLHEANEKRGSVPKSKKVRNEAESLDFPIGDIVMRVDGVMKDKPKARSHSDMARAIENEDTPEEGTLSIPPAIINTLAREDTIGEREGDEQNDHVEPGDTSHSMRIFDDEFGSVSVPTIPFDRSSVSFDLSLSNDNDSFSEQESVYYEQSLNDDTFSRRSGSRRDALRVFDDELGESASYARESIYSMRSTQSTVLEELEEDDIDYGATGSDEDGDSMLSEEASAELHESDDNEASSSAGNASRNKATAKSLRESNGETKSKNKMKFELPNELLESIHCLQETKNVDENQSDKDGSKVRTTRNETPVENEKDGSATYSTLPPTWEDGSRTFGDEAAEYAGAGISTAELIDEARQDCTRSDDETAQNSNEAQMDTKGKKKVRKEWSGTNDTVVETDQDMGAKSNSARGIIKVFPGRLPPNQRVTDKVTSRSVSFLAAFEMTTKHRRREIVLRSAEIASEGVLPVSSSFEDPENKYSRDNCRGGNQELAASLKATSRMATRAGRKKLVMESIKATTPKESWISRILSRQDDIDEQTPATTNGEITVKRSASSNAFGRKTSSKINASKRLKADGRNNDDSHTQSKNKSKNRKIINSSGESADTLELTTLSEPTASLSLRRSQSMEFKKDLNREMQFDSTTRDDSDREKNTSKSDEGKIPHETDGAELLSSKTRSRKRSKTRSRKAPGRSKSLGTEDFLANLSLTESMDHTGISSDDKDDAGAAKATKRTRNRTRGVGRSSSMGPLERSRLKRREEKNNGEGMAPTGGSRSGDVKEKRANAPCESEFIAPNSPRRQRSKSQKEQQNIGVEENSDILLSPTKNRRRRNSGSKSPRVEKLSLRRKKSGGGTKSPRNGNRKTIDNTRSPSLRKKSLEVLQSPSARKMIVNLTEDRKDELKSPRKNRSNAADMRSPKAEKPNLRRKKSGDGKSPRNSSRKSIDKTRTPTAKKKSIVAIPDLESDKIRSPTTKKKAIDTVPDLESELRSPRKAHFNRRSLESKPQKLAKKDGASKRRQSDSPTEKPPPPPDDASRQSRATADQQSAFMSYYDSVRTPPSRRSILKNGDELLALQISESSPSVSPTPSTKQKKSKLRRGQSENAIEKGIDVEPPAAVEDIWGLVKWRDQVDRL
ncbi:unnamed protein product [Cylindrotheca closterium]|uniref:Uncharacterized protein n=1 Tax=Cylindrotheca closterium TaxID=2856 RepID=A0AAD2JKQ6_9STRA|nr:unnamed protein product [Cylindrotheca closterium]